ncbi:MAG: class I SAM-dependent methyltransferase [Reichenbachiella sp.]|uniref:O-methyltransferase n=1 Tax=Reichenbachiella sp. TaxID=2184521 RepID=UPI003297FFAA
MDQHSLQSPFLFQLYQNALNPSTRRRISQQPIEALRAQLFRDNRSISLNKLGSGSSLSVLHSKRISSIAKSGITNRSQSEVLVNLIEHSNCNEILELGTSLGVNTIYLSQADGVNRVTTVEGNKELAKIAEDNFKRLGTQNIELIESDIDHFLDQNVKLFDFIYIDANHTFAATINYFKKSLQSISDHGLIVLDDINWSLEMRNAWQEIIYKFPNHIYMENNKLGIVFVNVRLERKHYMLQF